MLTTKPDDINRWSIDNKWMNGFEFLNCLYISVVN